MKNRERKELKMMWTEEKIEALSEMYAKGVRVSIIANRIGVSKGSAIGKANRLGIKHGHPASLPTSIQKRRYAQKEAKKGSGRCRGNDRGVPASEKIYGEGKNLAHIGDNDCRWPVRDLYCAAPVKEGSVYCENHHGVAYREQ